MRVRRSRNLNPDRVTNRNGIPVLRPAWVLLELAGTVPKEAFARAFKEADRLDLLDESELGECSACGKGVRGVSEFRRLVARRHPETGDARSLLEVLFLEICVENDIPAPRVNRRKGRYYPDFSWDQVKLIVEVDGYEGHAGRIAFLDDAARENELRGQGFQVIRFTWEEVNDQPVEVARLVKQELARCQALTRRSD